MRRLKTIILTMMLLPLTAAAQVKFGYLSYRTICQEMPQYVQAQQELQDLKATYEKEATRGEEEFQRKFADFLQGQKEFPANILHKRQTELQELMDRGIKFRKEAEQLLTDAERSMLKDLSTKLDEAIVSVGMETGYSFILNIDDHACPFINPVLGDDVSNLVREKLGIPVIQPELPAEKEQDGNGQESTDTSTPQQTAPEMPDKMPVQTERPE